MEMSKPWFHLQDLTLKTINLRIQITSSSRINFWLNPRQYLPLIKESFNFCTDRSCLSTKGSIGNSSGAGTAKVELNPISHGAFGCDNSMGGS